MTASFPTIIFWQCAALLVTAVVAGGSSQFGMVSTVVVELASLPLLGLAGWIVASRRPGGMIWPVAILAAGVAVMAAQLIPLPVNLWHALPGRPDALAAIVAAGTNPHWLAASLAPDATVRSLLNLLPGIAIFLGASLLSGEARRKLACLLLALGAVSAVVGMAQATGRAPSAYTLTNPGQAAGFFANRNHLATLLCLCLPLTTILARPSHRHDARDMRRSAVTACAIGSVLLLGVAATGSRAGLMLAVLGLFGAAVIILQRAPPRATAGRRWIPALLAIGAILALAALQFTRVSAFDRVGALDEGRAVVTTTTLAIAGKYAPIGAGLGTFVPAYATAEPISALTSEYFNHAHDDWAELWLEGGAPLALVVTAFLGWLTLTARRAWRKSVGGESSGTLIRAASVAIGLALLHSAVDYPLRTTTIIAAFGFTCALLTTAPQPLTRQRR